MERKLTPPDTPDFSASEEKSRKYSLSSQGRKNSKIASTPEEIYRKLSDSEENTRQLRYSEERKRELSPSEERSKKKSSVKYLTLPGASSFTVISNEKTNLKFGSVFSLSSLSDSTEKRAQKAASISAPSSEKPRRRRFSLLSKSDKSKKPNGEIAGTPPIADSESEATGSYTSPISESVVSGSSKKNPLKLNKLLKKLSFSSKKSKKVEEESEDTMDGKNGRGGKKKGSKNKFKKINPGDENAFSTAGSNSGDTPSSAAFVYNEREVKERETRDTSYPRNPVEGQSSALPVSLSETSTPTPIPGTGRASPPSDGNLLAPAQTQDLDSTTDNDDYDTPMGTSPTSSPVMPQVPVSDKVDEDLDATLIKSPGAEKVVSTPASTLVSTPTPVSTLVSTPTPVPTPDTVQSDVKSPSDLKKEILSITTPIVTESASRKKPEPKSSVSSSSSVERDTLPPLSPAVNGKEVSSILKMPPAEKREYLYKILVIGELGAGKTSIIKRYVHQFFSPHYRATIGVDFALKVLSWDPETIIRLQLWDIAGQERFGNMTRVYYKEAVGAFIVFDVTRAATFDAVLKWKQDLDAKVTLPDGNPIPCVLLANKCDQPKEGVANNGAKIDEFVRENKFSAWFETSAKDNVNIDEAAKALVQKILENDKVQANGGAAAAGETVFNLNRVSQEPKNGKNCAC